jgi:type IV secretion system protein VirB1
VILELAFVAQLADSCARSVAFETLAAVMRTESGFDPLAIGVNGPGGPIFPETRAAAIAIATDLIVRQHRSVDLGLMQVNSGNLPALGLSIAEAFDPCRNIAAGARLLRDGYATAHRTEAEPQQALRVAFSRYNTGSPEHGFANGYVTRVEDSAELVVPAIRLRGESAAAAPPANPVIEPSSDDPDAPPAWDVWARATHVNRPEPTATRAASPATPVAGEAAAAHSDNPSPEPRSPE